MRPEERVELFRKGMKAYVSGDVEETLTLYDPEIEVTAPEWMNAGPFHGHDGFLEWAQQWLEAWETFEFEILDVHAVGERHVVARVRVKGRGRGSEIEIDHEVGYVIDVQDGLATYLEITMNEDSAMRIAQEREVSN